MAEETQELINQLNSRMGDGPKLALVDPRALKLAEKNARYMDKTTFDQLVANIGRDGALESTPLCHKGPDGVLTVISGIHRDMAAREAGLTSIFVLVIDKPLSRGMMIAKQISHNAIVGQDDMATLKSLWEEIQDMEQKMYAGLDSEVLKELDKLEFSSISEAPLDFRTITLAFLPEEPEALKAALAEADVLFGDEDNYVLSMKHFGQVFEAVADVKEKYNIVSNPTAFMKLIELARERMAEAECNS
ncbi:MAG: ParB N-terminal domain-containing protein [Nitrospirae bacterium]|nr:ParB N-terminal domain-containing protein [Nitrospirota bacterium]